METLNIATCLECDIKFEQERDLQVCDKCVELFNMEESFRFKKPINLRLIEYRYDPDFIFLEQMYNRFDTSKVTCPVIYQHRE